MGLGITDDDIKRLHAAGDEIVDRATGKIQQTAGEAITAIDNALQAKVLQLNNIVSGVLLGLQGTVDSAIRQSGELLEGWELQIAIPPITIKLTKPKGN